MRPNSSYPVVLAKTRGGFPSTGYLWWSTRVLRFVGGLPKDFSIYSILLPMLCVFSRNIQRVVRRMGGLNP